MPVSLHSIDERGKDGFQPLAANAIRSLPQNPQCFQNGFVIDPSPFGRLLDSAFTGFSQSTDDVLAMKAGYFDEFVEDSFLFDTRRRLIPVRYRLSSRLLAKLSSLPILLPVMSNFDG